MPKIIQFLHTGLEATPINSDDSEIPWNNHDKHRRKFILSEGQFVTDGKLIDSDLTFWGEWEAQSKIDYLNNTKPKYPKYLNKPFLDPSVPERTHNTDPYVFGSHFRFVICMQRHFKMLKDLSPNSLILFGSSIDKKFCIDTVFVVSEFIQKYSYQNIEKIFNEKNKYYYASVNPMYDDTKFNKDVIEEESCRIKDNESYTFYKGVNYEEKGKYNDIYSFVPSKLYDSGNESKFVFKQPEIDLDIISTEKNQGVNYNRRREFSTKEIVHYWNKIKESVESKGLVLGVKFNNPPIK